MGGRKSGILAGIRARFSRFREAIAIRFLRPDLGRRGERLAARYLRRQGLRIIARNWRARSGEIDLIALVGDTLVFVEVKSRTLSERGDALERIDLQKARRIRRAALAFRRRARGSYARCRIDGVVVEFAPGRRGRPVPAGVRWYPGLHSMDELD